MSFRFRLDQIKNTIGNDHIDGVAGDQRMFDTQFFGELVRSKKRSGISYWIAFQLSFQQFQIKRQILDTAFAKFYVRVAEALRDDWGVTPGDLEHFISHIHADHFAVWSNDLRRDETNFSRATTEIENRFALAQIMRRIAAAIIALDHFSWNDVEICRFIINRTTKFVGAFLCSGRVTLADDGFFITGLGHSNAKL